MIGFTNKMRSKQRRTIKIVDLYFLKLFFEPVRKNIMMVIATKIQLTNMSFIHPDNAMISGNPNFVISFDGMTDNRGSVRIKRINGIEVKIYE
jgi:hypothetical protein